jgi:hypothetical protein
MLARLVVDCMSGTDGFSLDGFGGGMGILGGIVLLHLAIALLCLFRWKSLPFRF